MIVILMGVIAMAYLFPVPDDDESEMNSRQDKSEEHEKKSDGDHQEVAPCLPRRKMAILDEVGGILNPVKLYRARQAKEKRFQRQMDKWADLEKTFYRGPVENRGNVLEAMRKLLDEMSPYSDATNYEIAARSVALRNAATSKHDTGFIDTTPMDDVRWNDLRRMAQQLGIPARGGEESLKRAILIENARQHALRAAAPDRLDDLVIRLWRLLANTSAGKKVGGWWTTFLRDE